MNKQHTKKPLVSVIVPVYNCELFISEALQSIIKQDYRPIEIIVVDDGSFDKSAEIARSFQEILIIHQTNQGPAAAVNRGIASAKGEFLAFLPSDDLWVRNKLSRQVKHLLDCTRDGFVLCFQRAFFQAGIKPPPWAEHPVYQKDNPCFGFGAMLARKTVFEQVGGYNPRFRYGENAEWLSRAKQAGVSYHVLPETLFLLRIHDRNLSHHQDRMRAGIISALKSSIDRKRKSDADSGGE